MESDVLRQELGASDGFKLVGQFNSVEELRSYIPSTAGELVLLKSYYQNLHSEIPFGGGCFYYDATDVTTVDDGVFTFVTVSGARLKRYNSNGVITPAMAGATGDGVTVDDNAFDRLLSAVSARKDLWIVDGENKTYKLNIPIYHDSSKFSIINMKIDNSSVVSTETPFYALIARNTGGDDGEGNTIQYVKNVHFTGPLYRYEGNVHGLLLDCIDGETTKSIAYVNVTFRRYNVGIVAGSHFYLTTFTRCRVWQCFTGISDVSLLEGKTVVDAGENIRFDNCLFDSLFRVCQFGVKELEIRFYNTSFDYTGNKPSDSVLYNQFELNGTQRLEFHGCHFESGNVNGGWKAYGFYTTAAASVVFFGGNIRFPNQTYNLCPYFFFDTSSMATFAIDKTLVNGWGVNKWSNRGVETFRPHLKGLASQFTLYVSDEPIVANPGYVNGLDYQARGLPETVYTDRYHNDRLSIDVSSIVHSSGNVIPTLLIKKLTGVGQFCDVIVKFRRPVKAQHNNSIHGNLLFVAGPHQTSPRVIRAITGCITPGRVNNFGVTLEHRSTTVTTMDISLLDESSWYDVNTSWGANKSNQFLEFEYDMLRLDLTNLALNDSIHLFNVNWQGAF